MKHIKLILITAICLLTLISNAMFAREWTDERTIMEGWYYLRCMNNYFNLTNNGYAELRKLSQNEVFYVENKGGSHHTLKLNDGRYLGIEGSKQGGKRLKAVKEPYIWLIYWEAVNFNKDKSDIFSLRPPEANQMLVNASGQKNTDGTPIIIWRHANLDAPNHAEFRFIPVDTSPERWIAYTENGLMGYKDLSGSVMIKAQFDSAQKFNKGVAMVFDKTKGLAAYIDTTGKLITPYKYYAPASASIATDDLIRVAIHSDDVVKAVANGDGVHYTESAGTSSVVVMKSGKKLNFDPKYGFINTKGKEVIPLQFNEATSFQEGRALVFTPYGTLRGFTLKKHGYIDTTGKLVLPYRFGGYNSYDFSVFLYRDGLACFFEDLGKEGYTADNRVILPPGGIMDKAGNVIIPAHPDRRYPSGEFGLLWKDGVIVNNYIARVNNSGVPAQDGNKSRSFTELYDYSGKLIKILDNYTVARPVGGGYTLALYQVYGGKVISNQYYEGHWTVFDRAGKVVLDNLQKNHFLLLSSRPYGYANGYIYFADESHKVSN
jgi:hypothetical protein